MADLKISQLTGASTPLAGTEVLPIVQSGTTKQVSVANLTAGRTISGSKLDIKQLTGNWYDGVKVIRSSIDSQFLALGNTSGASWVASVDSAGGSNNQLLFGKSTNGTTFVETARFDGSDNFKINTGNLIIGTASKGIDFAITSSGSGTMTSELLADYEEGTWVPTQGAGLTVVGAFTSYGSYTKIGRLVSVYGTVFGATSVATTAGTIMFQSLPFSAAEISPVGAMNNDNRNVFGGFSVFGTTGYSATTIAASTRIDFNITYSV